MHSHARTKQANGTPRDLVNSIPVVLSSPAAAAFLSRGGEIFLSALFSSFVFFLESFLWSLGRDNEKDWTNARRTTLFLARASRLRFATDIVRVEASGTESRLSHEVSRRSSTGSAAAARAREWKESGDGKKAYSFASVVVTTEEEEEEEETKCPFALR